MDTIGPPDGVIVTNLRRNANIYDAGCGNADGTKIFWDLTLRMHGRPI